MMYVTLFITFVALILSIVSIIPYSDDEDVVKSLYWEYGESSGGIYKIYFGLSSAYTEFLGFGVSSDLDSDCTTSGKLILASGLIIIVSSVVSLGFSFVRISEPKDTVVIRGIAITSSVLGMLFGLIAVAAFGIGCFTTIDGGSAYVGPGYACMFTVVFMKIIEIIMHGGTPAGVTTSYTVPSKLEMSSGDV
jgi:hypothetical protein